MGAIWFLFIFVVWLIAFALILPRPAIVNKRFGNSDFLTLLGYEKVRQEAESFGWRINFREFIYLVVGSFIVGFLLAIFIGNFFFVAVGIVMGFMVPRYIVVKIKKSKRMGILQDLPDTLSLFTSRLGDFPSIQRSLEVALPEMKGRVTESIYTQALRGLQIGFPVDKVLDEMSTQIKIRKFNDFAEKLMMANTEGFNHRSISSLNQTIKEIAEDIKEIESLKIKSRKEKRSLAMIILLSWIMPIILSFLNSGNANIFLDTAYGQIFIVSFFITTLYTIMKGDDYLSLNLDEL